MIVLVIVTILLAATSVFLLVENIQRSREIKKLDDDLIEIMTKYLQIWRELNNN